MLMLCFRFESWTSLPYPPPEAGRLPEEGNKVRVLALDGKLLCRDRFCELLGFSSWKMKQWNISIRQGLLQPPADGRATADRSIRAAPKRNHVNAWLRWAHDMLAEPLAEILKNEECREQRNAAAKEPFE